MARHWRGRVDLLRLALDRQHLSPTNGIACSTNDRLRRPAARRIMAGMALIIVFLCGIANFAAHRAVLESGHPLVVQMHHAGPWLRPPVTLGVEFLALLVALLLVTGGSTGWAWGYTLYTLASGWTAWAILNGRM